MTMALDFVEPIVIEVGGIVIGDDGSVADDEGCQMVVTEFACEFK
jgi:hypothetical protein